jgi:hypothetical protein
MSADDAQRVGLDQAQLLRKAAEYIEAAVKDRQERAEWNA